MARVLLLLAILGAVLWLVFAGERPVARRGMTTGVSHTAATTHHGLSSLPLAAQGVVSAALGNANEAFRVRSSGEGYEAVNPAQRLHARFGRGDVHVLSGGVRVGLRLSAVGYGASLAAIGLVAPRAKGNRVVYPHPGLSEWYANGPLGLEQGFTLTHAPVGDRSRPLTLSLTLSGNTRATLDTGGHGLTLASAGSSLAYNDLSATDARGRALHAWIASQAGRVLLHVDARGARYPLHIDPVIQLGDMLASQGSKLTGKEETGEGEFGYSVALFPDGNTALVGAPNDNKKVGAVWECARSEGKWGPGVKIAPTEETGEGEFGYSVALSPDGYTALVGGPGDNKKTGAIWQFRVGSELWKQFGSKLTAKEEVGEGEFGYSIAIASSGNTALIGGPGDNKKTGAAWVFTRSENINWAQYGSKLTGKEETGEGEFGYSVALSYNEYTALIGGPGDNKKTGAAWEFTYPENKWSQLGAKLTGEGEVGEGEFGYSVAVAVPLEENLNQVLLVGGPGDNKKIGAAWVYIENKNRTQSVTKLTGEEEVGEGEFGYSVATSSNGHITLVGGPGDNKKVGAAWVFTCFEGACTQQGEKLVGGGEVGEGEFGAGVTLAASGSTALMGGFLDNKSTGGVWVYVTGSKLGHTGFSNFDGLFGDSVALSSEGNTALVGAPGYGEYKGEAWVFTRSNGQWTEQGVLVGKEETGKGRFGCSVSLSSSGNTALIGGRADNLEKGAAWVFTRSAGKWTQQGPKLTGGGEAGKGRFGYSVAISGEGGFLLIGAPNDDDAVGAAWAFAIESGKWIELSPKLTGEGRSEYGEFGYSVALSLEGTTALIGAQLEGAAYVFTFSKGTRFIQQAKLTESEGSPIPAFGWSVALSADGNTALIGAPFANVDGSAWVFTRSGEEWTQQAELTSKEALGEAAFGYGVALSSDGNTALIGGPFENEFNVVDFDGAAWVFRRSGAKWKQLGPKLTGNEEALTPISGHPSDGAEFGESVALSSEANIGLIGGPSDAGDDGAFWTFAT